jgi:hypothetical protein
MNTVSPVNNNMKIREGFSGLSDIFGSGGDSSGNDPSTSSTSSTDPNASTNSGSSNSSSNNNGGGGLLGMFGSGSGSSTDASGNPSNASSNNSNNSNGGGLLGMFGSGSGSSTDASGNPTDASGNPTDASGNNNASSGYFSGIPGFSNIIGGSTTDSTVDASGNNTNSTKNNGGLLGGLGIPGMPGTETNATMSAQETQTMNNLFMFMIHILISIVIAYVWGILGANALFLITESDEKKEFVFPTKPYALPYCDEKKSSNGGEKCWFSYGFPYSLGTGRVCNSSEQILHVIEKEEKNINIFTAFKDGSSGDGVSDALFNYLFNSVYGGLGRGGRTFAKTILDMFNPADRNIGYSEDTWKYMENSPIIKLLIFFIFPIFLIYGLIYALGLFSGICSVIFGVLNNHPFWGLFFTIFLGIPLFFGNAIYMGIQSAYLFGLYPCMQSKGNKYNDIFNNMKSKILYIFYALIIYYAFIDLGQYAGAGLSLFIIFSFFF